MKILSIASVLKPCVIVDSKCILFRLNLQERTIMALYPKSGFLILSITRNLQCYTIYYRVANWQHCNKKTYKRRLTILNYLHIYLFMFFFFVLRMEVTWWLLRLAVLLLFEKTVLLDWWINHWAPFYYNILAIYFFLLHVCLSRIVLENCHDIFYLTHIFGVKFLWWDSLVDIVQSS